MAAAEPTTEAKPTKHKVIVDNIFIYYDQMGNGPEVILLLPGALGSSADYSEQLTGLNHDLFTVIAWNPPGYGCSRPPNRNFTKGFYHQDATMAVLFMKTLNIEKYSLLGWSDGGTTALIIAAKQPQRVKHVIVAGCQVEVTADYMTSLMNDGDAVTWNFRTRQSVAQTVYDEAYFSEMWSQRKSALQGIYQDGGNICMELLPDIKSYALIIHGLSDTVVSLAHAKQIHDAIEFSRLETFHQGQHNVHNWFPKEFNKVVEKFVRDSYNVMVETYEPEAQ